MEDRVESLSPDEIAYQRRLTAQLRAAQAAWESWSAHLVDKYRIGPADAISESGEVHRAPETPADNVTT